MKLFNNVIYTDKDLPGGYQAINMLFIILMKSEFKDDKGLLAHEELHTKQVLRTFGLHLILYYVCEPYRFHAEAEAYALTVINGIKLSVCAEWLLEDYFLDRTYEECYSLIEKYVKKMRV